MKKLMTMLAAVGMAFGLFADEPITPISSTSFEAAEEFNGEDLIVNLDGSKWTCTDQDAKLTKGEYADNEAYNYAGHDMERYSTFDTQTSYLNVKTAFNMPLVRAAATNVNDGAVFFDQLVKFTAFEPDSDITLATDDKIAIFVMDESEAETPVAETNLYVIAGKYVNNALSVATNKVGAIDINEWHRLTIKTIKGFSGEKLAFEVFLDGIALRMNEAAFDAASSASLSDDAKVINKAKKLFPALSGTLALSGLALAGQGAIDDVMATTEVPGEWAEDKVVNIAWDDHVKSFTYTIGADATPVDAKAVTSPIQIAYATSFKVTISDVQCDENWAFDTIVTPTGSESESEIEFTGEKQTATITSKDVTPRVYVGDVAYPSLMAALENPIADGTRITLAADLTDANGVTVNENGYSLAKFKSNGSIVLDLAGYTIGLATGAELAEEDQLLNAYQCAGFTVTDSTGNGSIEGGIYVGGKFEASAVEQKNFFINGKVALDEGATSEVSGGSFLASANAEPGSEDEGALTLKTGFQAELAGTEPDYWVVSEMEKYKVTVTGAENATVKINGQKVTELELYDGAAYDVVVTPKDNYEYKEGGDYGDFTWDANTLTDSGTIDGAAVTLAAANATAIEWTIKYYNDDDLLSPTVFTTEKYSVATRETQTLNAGAKDGYTFNGWSDENGPAVDGDEVTYLSDKTGDIELQGSWTAAPTDVAITLPEVLPTGVESLVVSQSVDGIEWTLVEGGKIGKNNQYVVIAIPADGYKVENPIKSGTAEADIEVTEADFDGKIAKYVAQIVNGEKYTSLQAAVNVAENGDTVKIIAAVSNEAIQVTGTSTNDFAITLQNDASVTWTTDAGTQKYGMTINGAKVTFTGTGSWTKEAGTASLIQAGASLPAAIVVESGTFVSGEASKAGDANYKTVPSNAIASKWGSIVINGGSFANYRGEQGRCVRAEGTLTSDEAYPEAGKVEDEKVALYATLVVNGGEFTVVCPDGHDESTVTKISSHHVAVDNKGQATGSVTINGGKFKSPEWSVKNIMNAYCGEGYKLKDNGEGWYVKTAIDYATYKVTADEGVESYVVSNGTDAVAADAKFDIDDSVVLTVYPTLKANYELVTEDCVLSVTLTEKTEYELKVATKSAAPEIPEVAPGGSPVEVKAEDVDKVVIKATAPAGSGIDDDEYSGYFKKSIVDIGEGKVRVSAVLDETAIEFAESVEDLGEEVGKIAAGAESVTIAAKPGLYYYVEEANDVTKIAEPERDRVMATGATVTVPTTKFEGSGFYRLNCSTTQRGIVTGGQE